jgi:hypothetical protein
MLHLYSSRWVSLSHLACMHNWKMIDKLAVAAHGDSVIALFECRVSTSEVKTLGLTIIGRTRQLWVSICLFVEDIVSSLLGLSLRQYPWSDFSGQIRRWCLGIVYLPDTDVGEPLSQSRCWQQWWLFSAAATHDHFGRIMFSFFLLLSVCIIDVCISSWH